VHQTGLSARTSEVSVVRDNMVIMVHQPVLLALISEVSVLRLNNLLGFLGRNWVISSYKGS
jgi:hypothetical protein